MVERLKTSLDSDIQLLHDKRPNKECYAIEITNKKICDDLALYDIIPNKTYLLKDIKIDKIPLNL